MDAADQRDKVIAGTELIAMGTRGLTALVKGKTYKSLYGAEEGIFPSCPFVTVIGEHGRKYSCHLSRFKIKE